MNEDINCKQTCNLTIKLTFSHDIEMDILSLFVKNKKIAYSKYIFAFFTHIFSLIQSAYHECTINGY